LLPMSLILLFKAHCVCFDKMYSYAFMAIPPPHPLNTKTPTSLMRNGVLGVNAMVTSMFVVYYPDVNR